MPEPEASPPPEEWRPWGIGRLQAFLATILGAVTTLGFVAFTGGVILWAHAKALNLPADQVVAVAPRRELIATGASALTLFAVAGLVAVGVVYLFDRYGVPSRQTRLNLLTLLVLELIVAIVYADPSVSELILSGAILVLVVLGLTRMLFIPEFIAAPLGPEPPSPLPQPPSPPPADDWTGLRDSIVNGIREWGAALASRPEPPSSKPPESHPTGRIGLLELLRLLFTGSRRRTAERKTAARPLDQIRLTTNGSVLALLFMAGGTVAIWLVYDRWWVTTSVGLAFALYLVMIALARASGANYGGTAAAVLFSVVVFGAAVSALRYWQDKPVQPVAALRTGEAVTVCGIYLTEADDRMYVARIDRENAPTTGNSSQVFWISRKDTSGWAVGASQGKQKAEQALRQLSTRVLEERRARVKATKSHKKTTTTPSGRSSSKKKAADMGATSGNKTEETEETKTDLTPPEGKTNQPACSIYTAPAP